MYPPMGVPQSGDMDEELRKGLWTALTVGAKDLIDGFSGVKWNYPLLELAENFVMKFGPVLEFEPGMKNPRMKGNLHYLFFSGDWGRVYDFIEMTLKFCSRSPYGIIVNAGRRLAEILPSVLDRHYAGYALVNNRFIPASSDAEKDSIAECLGDGRLHLIQKH